MRSASAALKKGEDISASFRSRRLDCGLTPACSAGVALWRTDEARANDLIERADRALYQAKREQKGCCCLETDVDDGTDATVFGKIRKFEKKTCNPPKNLYNNICC